MQENLTYTVMSFVNCTKQPPSLLYLLMTSGRRRSWRWPLSIAAWDASVSRSAEIGRVPLFFYLMQWPVAHGLAVVAAAARGYPIGWMFRYPPFESPPGYGDNLMVVYLFVGHHGRGVVLSEPVVLELEARTPGRSAGVPHDGLGV